MRLISVLLLATGCSKDLSPNCERLAACCDGLPNGAACRQVIEENQDRDEADSVCAQSLSAFQAAGSCLSGGSSSVGPNCDAYEACCLQLEGSAVAVCVGQVAQFRDLSTGEKACLDSKNALAASGQCKVPGAPGEEVEDILCSDGVDNDGNGFADCQDRSCKESPAVTVCPRENDDVACSDGLDNDNNGFVDCADFGCQKPEITVCQEDSVERCHNGIDDDGNGHVDCRDFACDPYCEQYGTCMDRIDNDRDGLFDCDDPDCERFCESEDHQGVCFDGIDNDGDGFIDCDDYDCSRNPNVVGC